jgi:hypothetical protein
MDTNTALLGTGTGGTILGVLLLLYKTVNGKQCRTRCCGKDFDMGFQAGDFTPSNNQNNQGPVLQAPNNQDHVHQNNQGPIYKNNQDPIYKNNQDNVLQTTNNPMIQV